MTQNPLRRLIECAKALSAEYEFALNKSQWVETAKMWVSLRNALDAIPPAIAEGDVVMVPLKLLQEAVRDIKYGDLQSTLANMWQQEAEHKHEMLVHVLARHGEDSSYLRDKITTSAALLRSAEAATGESEICSQLRARLDQQRAD